MLLQHRLDVVGDLEGRFSLGLDLVYGNAIGQLDQGEAFRPVDVEYTL
jgi:hypothetical protein